MSKIILAATTSAATSETFQQKVKGQFFTIQVIGLAGSEKAYIEWYDVINNAWVDFKPGIAQTTFDSVTNVREIGVLGDYRIRKDATVASVGVAIFTQTVG